MFTRIPLEIGKFSDFINATDDCLSSIDKNGFTVFPKKPDGKIDYNNKNGRVEVKDQPNYKRWDWTAEESKAWSKFRNKFNKLFAEYSKNKNDAGLQSSCENLINELVGYDGQHHLLDRVAESWNTNQKQMEIFNIRQDVLKIKTSFRTIEIRYEKAIPLNDFENTLIEKYTALHEHVTELRKQAKRLRIKISNLSKQLPPLWEQYPVMRDKADKAMNRLFIPMPKMKGRASDPIAFKVPTEEEAQKNQDDFMKYAESFRSQYMEMYNMLKIAEAEEKALDTIFDEETQEYIDPYFKESNALFDKLFDGNPCASLDVCSLDEEQDEFRGAWGEADEIDKAHEEWCEFVDRYNLFNSVYGNFVDYTNGTVAREDDDDDEIEHFNIEDLQKPAEAEENDMDELQAETMQRYTNGQKNDSIPYFDTADWHIILDNFERKFDRKNYGEAMQRALEQHPEDSTMQIRKAQELANEHQYQPALDLLKKAEAQGPPHHPKLFFVKATVYRNLKSPDLAIPQYMRIINQDNPLLNEWKRYAYENLIDIYDEKKNYNECLRVALELLALFPDDELIVEKTAWAYNAAGKPLEGEDVLRRYLKHHPKSADSCKRLGHILVDKKEYRKAIEFYDKAFKINHEEYYEALYHKGLALMELKEYDEAAICFEHCLLYFKPSVDYHVGAAKAYDKLGMQEQVIYHYRQALANDPDCKEAVDYLLEFNRKKISP
jgi:tetratricopeptide (TPR) repeat protein